MSTCFMENTLICIYNDILNANEQCLRYYMSTGISSINLYFRYP